MHGNFFRVRFRDEQDLSRAEAVCKLARKYGVKITLEFMRGGDALNQSRAFAGLLKKYKDEIWAVRPSFRGPVPDLVNMHRWVLLPMAA